MTSTNDVLIRTENLHRDFQMGDQVVHALDGLSIEAHAGEFLAIMGPSGSGKSTLLYLLGGLDRPSEGKIWVGDREVTALDENELASYRRQEIGFVFQSFHLVATMTALQNVEFPMFFARVPRSKRVRRAQELLTMVGLSERMNHKPTELSGGQQQRVAIARALVNDPTIILTDEPTGNLDTQTGQEVMDALLRLNQEQGRTIVMVTHDPRAAKAATRHIHLLDGHITHDPSEYAYQESPIA